jgi:hypothetical protein
VRLAHGGEAELAGRTIRSITELRRMQLAGRIRALDKDDLSMLLTQAAPGETVTIAEERLRSIFGDGTHTLDARTRRAAGEFAEEHNCDLVQGAGGAALFRKRAKLPASGATD